MGNIDARFNGSVFRKNWNQVIATDRHLAKIIGVRMAWPSANATMIAGTVVARRTATGFYEAYNDSGSGGVDVAVGVTLDDLVFAAASGASGVGTQTAAVLIGGCPVYKDNLAGLDANAITDLKGRTIVDGAGVNLLVF